MQVTFKQFIAGRKKIFPDGAFDFSRRRAQA